MHCLAYTCLIPTISSEPIKTNILHQWSKFYWYKLVRQGALLSTGNSNMHRHSISLCPLSLIMHFQV